MAEPIVKRPLIPGQYAWSVSKKDGKLRTIIGPDPLEATEDDIFVVQDPDNPRKVTPVGTATEAIQDFVTLRTGSYAVVHSPTEATSDGFPNGNYTSGRNDMKPLRHGQKRMITAGHFPLWPGQFVEIRKIHELSSSQFLMVVVESSEVDEKSPFYDVTLKCAGIRKAVVDATIETEGKPEVPAQPADAEKLGPEAAELAKKPPAGSEPATIPEPIKLRIGQRFIIPGNLTPTYIPPTGIEVVSDQDEPAMKSGSESEEDPLTVVKARIVSGAFKIENASGIMQAAGLPSEYYENVQSKYLSYRRESEPGNAFWRSLTAVLRQAQLEAIARVLSRQTTVETTDDAAVREAVVLGPTEFCILFDEDGKPQTHKGPGRVFPGPYDRFRTEGSRNRVYDSYHLREDRGILLRVVAEKIGRAALVSQFPVGSEKLLDKEVFVKGDEVFLGGFDAYLVPSSSIEVINPQTRQPHIGNDHSEVYVSAIGVDQKSGVYVAKVATGSVELRKGETKLLLDPRKERQIKRRVPSRMWNLMIGEGEPHKKTSEPMVETPWALSIPVFNNKAALVTGKGGRRVMVGPTVDLLGFEEVLETLVLSKGRPKGEDAVLETCFLRVTGNRITDRVQLETADFVEIQVDICLGVEFVGQTPEERVKWFTHRNYVMFLCNNIRSRLRQAARRMTLKELYPQIPDFIRDTILGKKPGEGGDQHRPGLKFDENNMLVNEVEVLQVTIPDQDIAKSLNSMNRESVQRELEDAKAKAALESQKLRDQIDEETGRIKGQKADRDRAIGIKVAECVQATKVRELELKQELDLLGQAGETKLEGTRARAQSELAKLQEAARAEQAEISRGVKEANEKSALEIEEAKRKALVAFRNALAEIQVNLTKAGADADVARLNAIEPKLVEAIEGLGNKELAMSLAEHLPKAGGALGFLTGMGGLTALKSMVKGTVLEKGLDALLADEASIAQQTRNAGRTADES